MTPGLHRTSGKGFLALKVTMLKSRGFSFCPWTLSLPDVIQELLQKPAHRKWGQGLPCREMQKSWNHVLEDLIKLLIILHLGLLSSYSAFQLWGKKISPCSVRHFKTDSGAIYSCLSDSAVTSGCCSSHRETKTKLSLFPIGSISELPEITQEAQLNLNFWWIMNNYFRIIISHAMLGTY